MRKAPLLILGLGNLLLEDDGAGLSLLAATQEMLSNRLADMERQIEFLDGGTQGLALLDRLADREAVILLDAVEGGMAPGSIIQIDRTEGTPFGRSGTAHEANAGELLALTRLLGQGPMRVHVVGIQPGSFRTRIGLSQPVEAAVAEAASRTAQLAMKLLAEIGREEEQDVPCSARASV